MNNNDWLPYLDPNFAGDPYFPPYQPIAPETPPQYEAPIINNHEVEEFEDEEVESNHEIEEFEDEESQDGQGQDDEFPPYGNFGNDEPMEDNNEEHQADDNNDEEEDESEYQPGGDGIDGNVTEEENMPPLPVVPRTTRGKRPRLMRTARINAMPMGGYETITFNMFPNGPRHEVGESSQARSTDRLTTRVGRLEEEHLQDSNAIQFLYHTTTASNTNIRSHHGQLLEGSHRQGVSEGRLNALENRAQRAELRAQQLEDEMDSMRERFNELVLHYNNSRNP